MCSYPFSFLEKRFWIEIPGIGGDVQEEVIQDDDNECDDGDDHGGEGLGQRRLTTMMIVMMTGTDESRQSLRWWRGTWLAAARKVSKGKVFII